MPEPRPNWNQVVDPQHCPFCGEHRLITKVDVGLFFCEVCAKTFPAKREEGR